MEERIKRMREYRRRVGGEGQNIEEVLEEEERIERSVGDGGENKEDERI